MKLIHKSKIQPQYQFPEWDKELVKGYMFYFKYDPHHPIFWEIVYRFKDWFLVRKYD